MAYLFLGILIVPSQLFSLVIQSNDNSSKVLELRIIVVSSADRAQSILDRLNKGENFADLARSQSIDTTAADSGSMGAVAPSSLRPELRQAVAGLSPGQISPIVQIPIGFAILKVEAEKDSASASTTAANPAVAATGSVKLTISVGGFGEAESSLNDFVKPSGWDRSPRKICEMRQQSLAEAKESLDSLFAPESKNVLGELKYGQLLNALYSYGELYSYQGDMKNAMAQYEKAYRIAAEKYPFGLQTMNETMGVAYLHKSEIENGVYRTPGDRCLLPMSPANAFPNKEDSRKAIEYFLKYLENKPDDLEVRWLLNLAYMTIGARGI